MEYIFDIETDGLYHEVTKIHCLSYYHIEENKSATLTDLQEIKEFIHQPNITLIGHNIIRYDIPVLEKLLGTTYQGGVIDTLAISWYLFPDRPKHGLESYGVEFKIPKPLIEDWENLDLKDYIHRCERDVEINTVLWNNQKKYLTAIYEEQGYERLLGYLNFKFDCLLEQETVGITLDINLCLKTKKELEQHIADKTNNLQPAIPQDIGKISKTKPKNLYKRDGTLTKRATDWYEYLLENNLSLDTEVVYEPPNPNSHTQIKEWLYRLGWQPQTFKVSKATGSKVPQISLPFGGGICPSIKLLYPKEPVLKEMEDLFMLQHRLGLINSFLENRQEETIYATAHGFTNTLRLKHSIIVNLPSVSKPYGKEVRGCLKAPSYLYYFFGADISSLEDSSKQHYMYFFDPEYVTLMRVKDFDPHIDIAVLGELINKEEANRYKELDKKDKRTEEEDKEYHKLKDIRHDAKTVNFSCVYGAGPPKIAETLKKPVEFAEKLHQAYWERNKAVKEVANSTIVKEVYGQKWQYNPISGFWYYLKAEKDKFSTLNQGSGAYIFDYWLRKSREKLKPIGVPIILQYHDEKAGICLQFQKEIVKQVLTEAMEELNQDLKLNVPIGFSIDFGDNYASVH